MTSGAASPADRYVMGQHAPQFVGYAQHDSQELLNFLLDKLHEDLNRIKVKPYVENFEANGETDEEVAAEVLTRHRKRNDSLVADLFEGLFRSTIVCPVTGWVSVTFDPFMSVSVPIAAPDARGLHVTLRRLDGSLGKIGVQLPVNGSAADLIRAVSAKSGLPCAQLATVEIYNAKVAPPRASLPPPPTYAPPTCTASSWPPACWPLVRPLAPAPDRSSRPACAPGARLQVHRIFEADDQLEKILDGDLLYVYEVEHPAVFPTARNRRNTCV